MGEVYKARDTRLDRTVAIKILPDTLAADPQFHERFDREAKAISQLTHPNICTLYDVGEQDGTAYLVMEYLEGETLEQRLKKGALQLDEALKIAIQIADALSAAHRRGIVHRDLKPGNVMLTKQGAKLLDFGLAKASPPTGTVAGVSMLPTTPAALTMQGTLLGTFQYMAPEQLEGQEADARTDIWAFGAVLYEMITAKKAFEGKSQATLIAAIISSEPPAISQLVPLTPPAVDRVVTKCLAKNADDRWQSAKDLHDELTWIAGTPSQAAAVGSMAAHGLWRPRTMWILGTLGWLVAGLTAAVAFIRFPALPALRVPPARFSVSAPEKMNFAGAGGVTPVSVSPDGTRLVFAAYGEGQPLQRLWVRRLDSLEASPLPGTEEVSVNNFSDTFWSPDSRFIGFSQSSRLRRIAVDGGPPQTIATIPSAFGGATWNRDHTIVFSSGADGLFRVSDEGGDIVRITKPEVSQGERHRSPWFLPDGKHFLYTNTNASATGGIYVGSLDSPKGTRLVDVISRAMYVPGGYLLYVRDGTLLARPFDPNKILFTGDDSFPVAEGVAFNSGAAAF
jgi:hypothetical protein